MSLELLKEKFGYSGVTKEVDNKEKIHEKLSTRFRYKKDADNEEKIHEKLNAQFNDMGDIKSIKVQHQEQLDEKQRIIENFKIETSELANEIATLKKDKAVLLDDLNKSKWMEDKVHSTAKQIYEDKIKTMSYVDSTELIPLLISVSREKQGNTRLNWGNWLKISENKYLFQINESLAKRVFEDTNVLIDRAIGFINRKRTRGGDVDAAKNYFLSFTGDTAADSRKDYVETTFNPDSYDGAGTGLNRGFTVSYWVKPLELDHDVYFAFGKRSQANSAFQFGIKNANKIKIGIGSADKDDNTHLDGIGWESGDDNVAHGAEVGKWSHWVVTYGGDDHSSIGGDRQVRVWIDGVEILKNNASGGGMGTANWTPGWQNCDEGCDDAANAASYLYFGGRSAYQDLVNPYNQGWACSLSEVAIYNVEKDEDGTFANEVYNGGTGYDHSGNSGLVGYWKFNEGSGTTVKDYGPYEKHGTLTSETGDGGSGIPTWEER